MRNAEGTALTLAMALGLAAGARAQTEWAWTPKESRVVEQLEKKVGAKGGRFEVEGKSWTVETEVSARFTAETAAFMDLFSDFLTGALKAKVPIAVRPRVVVFSDETRYREIIKDGSRGRFRWAEDRGAFTEFTLYTFIKDEREREFGKFYLPILQHEGAHAILRTYLGFNDVPPWFDEGVATYFQFWDLRADARANRDGRYGRSIYRHTIKEIVAAGDETLPRLKDLLEVRENEWNPDSMGPVATRRYALAEGLMDYLQTTDAGQGSFKGIFSAVLSGKRALSDKDAARLEPLWRQHLKTVAAR